MKSWNNVTSSTSTHAPLLDALANILEWRRCGCLSASHATSRKDQFSIICNVCTIVKFQGTSSSTASKFLAGNPTAEDYAFWKLFSSLQNALALILLMNPSYSLLWYLPQQDKQILQHDWSVQVHICTPEWRIFIGYQVEFTFTLT